MPENVRRALEKRAESEGCTVEELPQEAVVEVILKTLDMPEPKWRGTR